MPVSPNLRTLVFLMLIAEAGIAWVAVLILRASFA